MKAIIIITMVQFTNDNNNNNYNYFYRHAIHTALTPPLAALYVSLI